MREIQFAKLGPALSEADIIQAEGELGIEFPQAYKDFLMKYYGGRPKLTSFPLFGDSLTSRGSIHWLYSINKVNYNYDIIENMHTFKGRIPTNFLTIGEDPGGNIICISFRGPDAGKVYYWDHEGELDKSSMDSYENVYFIADSFEEFINSLTAEER
ncbi:MAG: SMI1/KNR4 family protein [Chloroflexi bacterium]|uniref:SMI1/KNR4 family protein n=1 Tax=Candidatus Chlorohelix allophototropha TaxID=3003348 RepID=A0A8T7M9I0_9CHLR|nr:SMI1/KNR4 family protein [Chloroflexota bacterium]WJW68617.1 SMI1/KNR4 family protein [Chloroflexota bacterium L227-S17]